MEINARIASNGRQLLIKKMGKPFTSLMTIQDARLAHEQGRITKTNKCFDRLVELEFDVKKTLKWYVDERKRLQEKSSTDET